MVILLRSCALLLALFASNASAAPAATEAVGEWSPTVQGVRGRLIATPLTPDGKRQIALALELENVSDNAAPIAIGWGYLGDMMKLVLEDEAGTAIEGIMPGGNHIDGPPFWLSLPVATSVRTIASRGLFEYVPNGRVLLRPFAFVAWELSSNRKPGKLYLRATVTPHAVEGKKKGWTGPLQVPRVVLPGL